MLDITHGADYYRRWHRQKTNSGSLWVHKATHHFDLVNWLAAGRPQTVYAQGTKRFYRPETFPARERCLTCDAKKQCRFYLDISQGAHRASTSTPRRRTATSATAASSRRTSTSGTPARPP